MKGYFLKRKIKIIIHHIIPINYTELKKTVLTSILENINKTKQQNKTKQKNRFESRIKFEKKKLNLFAKYFKIQCLIISIFTYT